MGQREAKPRLQEREEVQETKCCRCKTNFYILPNTREPSSYNGPKGEIYCPGCWKKVCSCYKPFPQEKKYSKEAAEAELRKERESMKYCSLHGAEYDTTTSETTSETTTTTTATTNSTNNTTLDESNTKADKVTTNETKKQSEQSDAKKHEVIPEFRTKKTTEDDNNSGNEKKKEEEQEEEQPKKEEQMKDRSEDKVEEKIKRKKDTTKLSSTKAEKTIEALEKPYYEEREVGECVKCGKYLRHRRMSRDPSYYRGPKNEIYCPACWNIVCRCYRAYSYEMVYSEEESENEERLLQKSRKKCPLHKHCS